MRRQEMIAAWLQGALGDEQRTTAVYGDGTQEQVSEYVCLVGGAGGEALGRVVAPNLETGGKNSYQIHIEAFLGEFLIKKLDLMMQRNSANVIRY